MKNGEIPRKSDARGRERFAETLLAAIFEKAGWEVQHSPHRGGLRPDMLVRRGGIAYAVEVKAAPEGRRDRLVPLLAQAVLQSQRAAAHNVAPLAVVSAPKIAPSAAAQVIKFAEDYSPDTAVGVIDFGGLRMFRGAHLEQLNAEAKHVPLAARGSIRESGHLFSDLNQWMLKVLLAPEIPDGLLSAPRGRYRNASQLARAANVSVMSAFRFVQQLQHEGFLESAPYLNLVRREDLFNRWQALAVRSVREVPMRFVLPGDVQRQLRKMLGSGQACLALFAAADALKLGFVHGVPPYVYVHQRVQAANLAVWKNLRPCGPNEPPDVIVRQAPSPQSVLRGMVRPASLPACDVLQVWVDLAAHPSRGREQADLIRKRVLERVIEGRH
jgi:hypothetical protein